jgi:hypothetical protein
LRKPVTALRVAALRAFIELRSRAAADDRGQSASEYFMLGAVILGIIGLIVAPRAEDIIGRLMNAFDAAVPG